MSYTQNALRMVSKLIERFAAAYALPYYPYWYFYVSEKVMPRVLKYGNYAKLRRVLCLSQNRKI